MTEGGVRSGHRIRRLGFKRWFERQLIESHVYLVTCFLCLILALAVFEELNSSAGALDRAGMFALILAAGALGIASWNRYRITLLYALRLSEHSVCNKCRAYAKFSVMDSARHDVPESGETHRDSWLRVKCQKCGNEWTIA